MDKLFQEKPRLEVSVFLRWLANFYMQEITPEILAAYQSKEGQDFLAYLETEESLHPVLEDLKDLISDHQNWTSLTLDLAGDYSRVFLGAGRRHFAPPYASAYLSDTGLLYQKATSEMQSILRDLNIGNKSNEAEDHLSIQLNILAELINRSEESESTRHAINFVDQHLLAWLPEFHSDCQKLQKHKFYGSLTGCLIAFLKDLSLKLKHLAFH